MALFFFRPIFKSAKLKLQKPLTADIVGVPLPDIDSSEALEKAREAAELSEQLAQQAKDAANLAETCAESAAEFSAQVLTEAEKAVPYISVSTIETEYAKGNATEANSTIIEKVLVAEILLLEGENSLYKNLKTGLWAALNNANQAVRATYAATSPANAQIEARKASDEVRQFDTHFPLINVSRYNREAFMWDLENKAKDVNTTIQEQIRTATSHFDEAQNANQRAAGELSSAESILADAENKLALAEEQRAIASSAVEEAKTQVLIAQLALEASDNDAAVEIYVQSAIDALENAEKFADEAQTNVANAEVEVEIAKQHLELIEDALVDAEKATTDAENILSAAGLNLNAQSELVSNFSAGIPVIIAEMSQEIVNLTTEISSARNSAFRAQEHAAAMALETTQTTSTSTVPQLEFENGDTTTTTTTTTTVPPSAAPGPTGFRVDHTYLLTAVNVSWEASLTTTDSGVSSLEVWTVESPSSCSATSKCPVSTFVVNTAGFFIIDGMTQGQGMWKNYLAFNYLSPGSNVLPKILPFCCKSGGGGGGGNLPMGVNWCKSVGVFCSEAVKWCKSWAALGGFFKKMQLKTLTSFWAALGFQRG